MALSSFHALFLILSALHAHAHPVFTRFSNTTTTSAFHTSTPISGLAPSSSVGSAADGQSTSLGAPNGYATASSSLIGAPPGAPVASAVGEGVLANSGGLNWSYLTVAHTTLTTGTQPLPHFTYSPSSVTRAPHYSYGKPTQAHAAAHTNTTSTQPYTAATSTTLLVFTTTVYAYAGAIHPSGSYSNSAMSSSYATPTSDGTGPGYTSTEMSSTQPTETPMPGQPTGYPSGSVGSTEPTSFTFVSMITSSSGSSPTSSSSFTYPLPSTSAGPNDSSGAAVHTVGPTAYSAYTSPDLSSTTLSATSIAASGPTSSTSVFEPTGLPLVVTAYPPASASPPSYSFSSSASPSSTTSSTSTTAPAGITIIPVNPYATTVTVTVTDPGVTTTVTVTATA